MRVILTDHAKERLSERLGAKPAKHQKLAEKAWRSTEPVDMREVTNAVRYIREEAEDGKRCEWRKLMGMVFCFGVPIEAVIDATTNGTTEAVLRTVCKPANFIRRGSQTSNPQSNKGRNEPPRKVIDTLTHPKSKP